MVSAHRGDGLRFSVYDKPSKKNLADVKTFSDRLAYAIERSGKSKGCLAAACEVPQSSVSRWLKDSTPRPETIYRIAKFLSVDAQWLSTGHGGGPSEVCEDVAVYGGGSRRVGGGEPTLDDAFALMREALDVLQELVKRGNPNGKTKDDE